MLLGLWQPKALLRALVNSQELGSLLCFQAPGRAPGCDKANHAVLWFVGTRAMERKHAVLQSLSAMHSSVPAEAWSGLTSSE